MSACAVSKCLGNMGKCYMMWRNERVRQFFCCSWRMSEFQEKCIFSTSCCQKRGGGGVKEGSFWPTCVLIVKASTKLSIVFKFIITFSSFFVYFSFSCVFLFITIYILIVKDKGKEGIVMREKLCRCIFFLPFLTFPSRRNRHLLYKMTLAFYNFFSLESKIIFFISEIRFSCHLITLGKGGKEQKRYKLYKIDKFAKKIKITVH